MKNRLPELYGFNDGEKEFFEISNGEKLYVDRKNDNYVGFKIIKYDIVKRENNDNKTNDLINDFFKDVKTSWWKKLWGGGNVSEKYDFTKENIIYIMDNPENNGDSKFLSSPSMLVGTQIIDELINKGNAYFNNIVYNTDNAKNWEAIDNFYEIWSSTLSSNAFDDEIKKEIK